MDDLALQDATGEPTHERHDAGGALTWPVDPILYALVASDKRRRTPDAHPEVVCAEVGRRLLLAQFEFSQWVLRRVEKVSFSSDRRVARRSSIEFRVRDDAPVLVTTNPAVRAADPVRQTGIESGDGSDRRAAQSYWLVPLSVMRRRTLVGLDIRDESGESLRMLGLRFTQKLDESMLRAAAMLGRSSDSPLPPAVEGYIRTVISGPYADVREAKRVYRAWQAAKASGPAAVGRLPSAITAFGSYFDNVLFAAALERMWHNFTLYVLLPADTDQRHRLLQLAFEERITWRFQEPHLAPPDYKRPNTTRQDILAYQPMRNWLGVRAAWRELFGIKTTRIRLLTPSAENCASYHFEFTAPTGLGISGAALLAGRPNDQEGNSTTNPSWDRVDNPGHSVGLHAVEIPNGSLCRAQVDLRIPSRGWLSTLTVAVWAIAIVMGTVLFHARLIGDDEQWTVAQVTNIVLLLVTVTAGAVTYVAHHHSSDIVARMVTGLRLLGTAALAIPSVATVLLVYLRDEPSVEHRPGVLVSLGLLSLLSVVAAVILTGAWAYTQRDERRHGEASPWDMSSIDDQTIPLRPAPLALTRNPTQSLPGRPLTSGGPSFDSLVDSLGFAEKAVGVASAEGWHEIYGWNDTRQATALRMLGRGGTRGRNPTGCRCVSYVSELAGPPEPVEPPGPRRGE